VFLGRHDWTIADWDHEGCRNGRGGAQGALVQRLSDYMKYPRVDLYVDGYQTREVAVTGAVQKPGRYDLSNRNESIVDMIGRAGGMTSDSAQRVIFVPATLDEKSGKNADSAGSLPRMSRDAPRAGTFHPTALEDETPFSPHHEESRQTPS